MALNEQMEMFEDGGLMDEGGTVDPVSGNDVPPGSTQEEVRDDIPAQLSEGEFVFPADVVRYIGLGNLMRMRQEAKMGLKLMDEMGQMGNSEEATMPDDLPFDINDLDTEDEPEYNVGGFVPAQQQQQQFGIAGYTPAQQPTTGFVQQPTQAASQQFVQPTSPVAAAAVPTMQQYTPAELPSFQSFVGGEFGGYDELREYRNEAGNVIQVPFKDGQPISPIPEGYTFVDPEAIATEEVTTTPTTPQTTSVRDTSDSDERRRQEEEAKYGPGGGRLGVGNDIYGVSFDGIKGIKGGASLLGGLITGGLIPASVVDGVSVTLQNEDGKFTVTGQEYNAIKQSIKETGAKSTATQKIMDNLRIDAKTREAQRAIAEVKKEETRRSIADILAGKDSDGENYTGTQESIDTSRTGAALEASLKGSATPGGTGKGRQDYSGATVTTSEREDRESDRAGAPNSSSGGPGQGSFSGGQTDRGSGPTAGGYGGTGRGRSDYAEGGLAAKSKPKAKKMKRGGLASKK